MRRVFALAVAAVALTGSPVRAANKELERLQIQVAYLQTQLNDVQKDLRETLAEVKRLNESLAEQNVQVKRALQDGRTSDDAAQTALHDLSERVADLGQQIQGLKAAAAAVVPPPEGGALDPGSPVGGPTTPPPAPRELYGQAYADYARGNYDLAIQEYEEYLRNYPGTDLADNAQYWVGECHYAKQRYTDALNAWDTLLRNYAGSDKIPDARFKKGMALERLGRKSQALVEWRYVVDHFPNSEAGRKAREKLNP